MATARERILTNLSRFDTQSNLDPRVTSVVMTLREVLSMTGDTATNEAKKEILVECLDVDTLSHPSIALMTHLCRQIKETMILIGLSPSENRRKRLPIRIAEGLGLDVAAISEIEAAIASRAASPDQGDFLLARTELRTPTAESSTFSIAKAISSRYSDSARYSGQIEESNSVSFNIFRATYMTAMEELSVPRDSRPTFVHHALKGPALDFYHAAINRKVTQLAEIFKLLDEKFLSESVKLGICTKLLSLRITDFQTKEDCSKLEAVEIAKRQIYNLSQQGQPEHRSYAAMIDVMEKSVLTGEGWSTELATRRATQTFSFDEYCTALMTWIRATVEKNGVRNSHGFFGKPSESLSQTSASIHYGEQYSDRRVSTGRGSPHSSERKFLSQHLRGKSLRNGNCRRCGKPGHWKAECTDRKARTSHLDALHARLREVGGGAAGIAKVLFEVGEEVDVVAGSHCESEDDSGEQEDVSTAFEEFFLSDRDELSQPEPDFRSSRVQTRD